MNIIRDPNQAGMSTPAIQMVPLLTNWGISRCNIAGCKESPTTIVSAIPDCPTFGMCEGHFQEATNTVGNYKLNLEF